MSTGASSSDTTSLAKPGSFHPFPLAETSVCVFVSSPFQDMDAEREELVKRGVPLWRFISGLINVIGVLAPTLVDAPPTNARVLITFHWYVEHAWHRQLQE